MRSLLIAALCLLVIGAPALAQEQSPLGLAAYAWTAADLTLYAPDGWRITDDNTALSFTSPDDAEFLQLSVEADTVSDPLLALLQGAFTGAGLTPTTYDETELFGQAGITASGATADGLLLRGAAARLPDGRALLVVARLRDEAWFTQLVQSVVFSASATPTPPQAALFWHEMLPEPISFADVTDPRIAGLTLLPDGRLVAVDPARGLVFFRPGVTGAEIIPFPNPSQPTGIASDAAGQIYVSDSVCRCIQVYARGGWAESIGAFAGGAPWQVAIAPDGALAAIDGDAGGYSLWVSKNGVETRIPLTFNAAAPPLLLAGGPAEAPRLLVLEWLQSLIDNSVHAAVSQVEDGALELQTWIDTTPNMVKAAAILPDGGLAVAHLSEGIARVLDDGSLLPISPVRWSMNPGEPRALTAGPDGALYVGLDDGRVLGRRMGLVPDRTGDGWLLAGVPAQGLMSEGLGAQFWVYAGRAGEVVTINATDLQRRDTLDMEMTLWAPGEVVLANNDDQLGLDLWGIYDAQIPALTLPETGYYHISISPVAGEGVYTLGLSLDQALVLHDTEPTRLTGTIQDVFPAQRYVFTGRAGQTLTITMIAQSGTLDPVLELFLQDGRRLAYNDDAAEDLTLENNAQLFRIALPRDDTYILKAGRYEGIGGFEIVITPNS